MGFFDRFKKQETVLPEPFDVSDDAIAAIADGKLIDVKTVSEPLPLAIQRTR